MEDKREYIEIDSTYRDRRLFPNPSDFTVNVSSTGTVSDANDALNPLSKAYPIYNFQGPHPELLGIDKDSFNLTAYKKSSLVYLLVYLLIQIVYLSLNLVAIILNEFDKY